MLEKFTNDISVTSKEFYFIQPEHCEQVSLKNFSVLSNKNYGKGTF